MGLVTCHLQFRAPSTRLSVTFHHVMNYCYLTTLLVALLSVANGTRPPDDDDDTTTIFDTQNSVTDINVAINYETQKIKSKPVFDDIEQIDKYVDITEDTQTSNYETQTTYDDRRQVVQDNDIKFDPSITPSIKNDQTATSYEPLPDTTHQIDHDSPEITYPMTQLAPSDDKITFRYDSGSKQTKKVENSNIDITPASTHYAPTSPLPVDACNTQYLEVTSTPVHVMPLARLNGNANLGTNCSLYVTAPNDSAISVKLIPSNLNDISTYFYMEHLDHLPQNCTDRYIVLSSVTQTPCAAIIITGGNQFKIFFQNIDVLIELQTTHVQISTCFYLQSVENWPLKCKFKSYAKRIQRKIEYSNLDLE